MTTRRLLGQALHGPCCCPPGIGVDPGDRIGELGTPPGPLGPALPPTWKRNKEKMRDTKQITETVQPPFKWLYQLQMWTM